MSIYARLTKNGQETLFLYKANCTWNGYYDYSEVMFQGMRKEVKVICPIHGAFYVTPSKHIKGEGCPICGTYALALALKGESNNEVVCMKYFIDNNIKYIYQYRIDNEFNVCKNKYFFIDFFLPEFNIAIEINGAQHYKPIKIWGGDENFEHQKKRDESVRMYCENHGINLIEINSTCEDVIDSLSKIQMLKTNI